MQMQTLKLKFRTSVQGHRQGQVQMTCPVRVATRWNKKRLAGRR